MTDSDEVSMTYWAECIMMVYSALREEKRCKVKKFQLSSDGAVIQSKQKGLDEGFIGLSCGSLFRAQLKEQNDL